jgi:hypothetical protein
MKLTIAFITFFGIFFSSHAQKTLLFKGEGTVTMKTISVNAFEGINLAGAENVVLQYGENQEVKVKGHPNIIERIKTEVKAGIWKIQLDKGSYKDYELTYYITIPKLKSILLTGSGDVKLKDFKNTTDLTVNLSGSGDVEFNEYAGSDILTIDLSGSGDVNFKTQITGIKNLIIKLPGSGDINASNALTENCTVKLSGSGDCKLNVKTKLDVSLPGSGNITYKGNPEVKKAIPGSGELKKEN